MKSTTYSYIVWNCWRQPDGTYTAWEPWNLYPEPCTSRTVHRFTRQDRQLHRDALFAVRDCSVHGCKAPRPVVGMASPLHERFTPPYPVSC
jgi:hypothetical protein